MEYVLLSDVGSFSDERISIGHVTVDNYISTENMVPNKGGVIQASSLPDAKKVSKYNPGDILLSNIRPYFKKIWFADCIGGCSNDVLVFHPNKDIDAKFLYYVLSDNNFFNYATLTSKGTKMPRGTKRAILKYWIPNLSLATQQKIASLLSAYDSQIENNQKRIKLLEQMAESLYKEWFVRFRFPGYETAEFEDGLPKGWRCGKLKNIAQDSGKSEKKDNRDKYPAYVPIDCIGSHSMVLGSMDSIENAESSLVSFKKTDILFGAMRPYFHKVIMAPFSGLTRSTCFVISPKDESYRYFLYLLLFQKSSIDYATTICVGSTMPYTVWKDYSRMPIVIPTEDIVIRFAKVVKPIIDSIESIYFCNNYLVKQRDLLLPRLMSGKLSI